jgi:hypothetical protein
MTERPQKITFGEMRDMGVRGILVWCADYRCSHSIASAAIVGPTMSGYPTLSIVSSARSAASAVPTCGRISRAKHKQPEWRIATESVEGSGPLMFAEIAVGKAVNAGKPRT